MIRTIEILKTGKVPYEFRTTLVPELVTMQDAVGIAELVKGAKPWRCSNSIPPTP